MHKGGRRKRKNVERRGREDEGEGSGGRWMGGGGRRESRVGREGGSEWI